MMMNKDDGMILGMPKKKMQAWGKFDAIDSRS
jgi:hypothetical protein